MKFILWLIVISIVVVLLLTVIFDYVVPKIKRHRKLKKAQAELTHDQTLEQTKVIPDVSADQFAFVQMDEKIFDKKFETKAIGYFGDAARRFAKNKSSVVAFFMLLIVILLAIVGPFMGGHDAETNNDDFTYLPPKLNFLSKLGLFDGTVDLKGQRYDLIVWLKDDPTADYEKNYFWEYIKEYSDTYEVFSSQEGKKYLAIDFKYDKYQLLNAPKNKNKTYASYQELVKKGAITSYATTEVGALKDANIFIPTIQVEGNATFWYVHGEKLSSTFKDSDLSPNTRNAYKQFLDASGIRESEVGKEILQGRFTEDYWRETLVAKMAGAYIAANGNWWINDIDTGITAISYELGKTTALINGISKEVFTINGEATTIEYTEKTPVVYAKGGFWYLGLTRTNLFVKPLANMPKIGANGNWYIGEKDTSMKAPSALAAGKSAMDIANDSGYFPAPLTEEQWLERAQGEQGSIFINHLGNWTVNRTEISKSPDGNPQNITYSTWVNVLIEHDFKSVDDVQFIFGTDGNGRDLWSRVWQGTRTSLLIGLFVAIVTVTVGIIWGSISGFYGGKVDLIMERFVEVLTGIPWIVIMTLTVLYLGANIYSLVIALVLTSWTGTAGAVRSQFYRYKNREYVLAAKTLGAKDWRLIFKHILPNALGPIVTASVLIIPSAIFSEATISYLGLGLANGISIGKLLADGQAVGITTYSYMTLFPALVISILMISFNLFGNGLRDALNPSLRGVD